MYFLLSLSLWFVNPLVKTSIVSIYNSIVWNYYEIFVYCIIEHDKDNDFYANTKIQYCKKSKSKIKIIQTTLMLFSSWTLIKSQKIAWFDELDRCCVEKINTLYSKPWIWLLLAFPSFKEYTFCIVYIRGGSRIWD